MGNKQKRYKNQMANMYKNKGMEIKHSVKTELKQESAHMLSKLSFWKRAKIAWKVLRGVA